MRALISVFVCIACLLAQDPPDAAAFRAAYQVDDPTAKIAALDRFLAQFPSSTRAAQARRELVLAAIEANPKDAVRRVKTMTPTLAPVDAASLNRLLAEELNRTEKLPAEAERAARQALSLFTFEAFAAQARDDGQLRGHYSVQMAQMRETLGQALLGRGRRSEAKAAFLEALEGDPRLSAAAAATGAILDREGNRADALAYHAQAMLVRGTVEARTQFSEAYRKVHGSAAGESEFLDARYTALFPNPLPTELYPGSARRSTRLVLAELYTGAGCGPCVAADLAFDSVLARYTRSDVAVVVYHENIPRLDPLATAATQARWLWQAGSGVPTYAVDGQVAPYAGGARADALKVESRLRPLIERQLEASPGAAITLTASPDGRTLRTSVSVQAITRQSPDLVLQLLLVEKMVRYSGENGLRFHPMVVRSMAVLPAAGGAHEFNLPAGPPRIQDWAVVAFLQDMQTREVIQTAYTEPGR